VTDGGPASYPFDPELAPAVPHLPAVNLADVAYSRQLIDDLMAPMLAAVDESGLVIDDRQVPGPRPVPVRCYVPEGRRTRPALLHIHGGGFVVGSIDSEHPACVDMARQLDAVVVSVEYRLAPEHPFPAGLDDCFDALVWLHGSAAELGVDPDRIAVYGASAGGGLAAGLALLARDRGGPPLCFQFLGIPELDDRLATPSMTRFVDTPLWNRPAAELSWRYYLGDSPGEVSPYAAPARATDLAGLPPAYVSTMEFDPLRDEGIAYAAALLAAGVPVELHQFPGTFHGSSVIADAAVSRRQAVESIEVLRRALAPRSPA
jgi:acetyl esterase/lipase